MPGKEEESGIQEQPTAKCDCNGRSIVEEATEGLRGRPQRAKLPAAPQSASTPVAGHKYQVKTIKRIPSTALIRASSGRQRLRPQKAGRLAGRPFQTGKDSVEAPGTDATRN